MQNKLQITIKEQTELTQFINGIIKGSEKKDHWITLSDFAGFIRLFQCVYGLMIQVKFNEDDAMHHLNILEDGRFVAAVTSKKEDACISVHKFIKVA